MNNYKKIKCPKCDSRITKVILVRDCISSQTDIVRRRLCATCGHRFYTMQPQEEIIHAVEYSDHGNLVSYVFVHP